MNVNDEAVDAVSDGGVEVVRVVKRRFVLSSEVTCALAAEVQQCGAHIAEWGMGKETHEAIEEKL